MPPIYVSRFQSPMIQPNQLVQNGKPVTTTIEGQMRSVANQLIAYQGKGLFHMSTPANAVLTHNGGSARTRWRFYAHLGPYTQAIMVRMRHAQVMPDSLDAPSATFALYKASDNTLIDSVTFTYGLVATMPSEMPNAWGMFEQAIDVTGYADLDVYGVFSDDNYGRLVSGCVWELGPPHDTANGYQPVPSPAIGANIYDKEREDLVTFANLMWKRGGAHLLNWCNDAGTAQTIVAPTSPTNILDGSSTTNETYTPGFTLDGTGRDRAYASTYVPVKFAVYGRTTGGDNGSIMLYDVDNNDAGLAEEFIGTTLGWYVAEASVPASSGKLDVMTFVASGDVEIYAFCILEYAP